VRVHIPQHAAGHHQNQPIKGIIPQLLLQMIPNATGKGGAV
jgi:hypothetical protein